MQNRGMELQLGLALSINPIKGFDLNDAYVKKKKRNFDEAFEKQRMGMGMGMEMGDETLPLLVWGDQPQDNDDSEGLGSNSAIIDKGERDENGVVGWPPINSWRKKLCHHHHQSISGQATTILEVAVSGGGGGGGGWRSNSTYVKVKMEGVAIGRKVDLSLHHSYETLTDTLIGMFGKWSGNGKAYELTYQDQEGDWLLAGDVPWGTFIQSVQRLKLQKNHN